MTARTLASRFGNLAAGLKGLIIAVFFFSSPVSSAEPDQATLDKVFGGLLRKDLRVDASSACATAGCHGGPRPGVSNPHAARGNEYQLWLERDPHAQSWRTMCSDASVQMLERLNIIKNGVIVDRQQFNNCLACHDSKQMPVESTASSTTIAWQGEGVGCGGCHGPSEKWGTSHYLRYWNPGDSSQSGFVPAGDLLVRARMCASCHVGDRDRDMNHDIIAAGHPALRFEMATYHNRLPKHWRDPESVDRGAYEAQLWAAGAVASADAWLALQQGRAEGATAVSTWPEFAAYDCSSCHHSLSLNNARDPLAEPSGRANAKQSEWDNFAIKQMLLNRHQSDNQENAATFHDQLLEELADLKQTLEANSIPDRQEVAQITCQARQSIAAWAAPAGFKAYRNFQPITELRTYRPEQLVDLVKSATVQDAAFGTWESAVQYYLLTVASRHAWPIDHFEPLKDTATSMRRGLALPPGLNSPQFLLRYPDGPQATSSELKTLGETLKKTLERRPEPTPASLLRDSSEPTDRGLVTELVN